MAKTYLVVHRISYKYIKNIADYIWQNIVKYAINPAEFQLANSIDEVGFVAGSTVFVIGDPFKVFQRTTGVTYIFLNFSVLAMTGSPFSFGFGAYRLLSHKRKILEGKLGCFDHVLDYWPAQTSVLEKKFKKYGKQIESFPVGLCPTPESLLVPLSARKYDVCFVGSITARRKKVLAKIAALGISLSPSSGVDLEEAARDSRIVLNLHAHRSEHLESPRILGAFSTRAALVTEQCDSLHGVFPSETYFAFAYADLPLQIKSLLDKSEMLESTAARGYCWLKEKHMDTCEQDWSRILKKFEQHETPAVATGIAATTVVIGASDNGSSATTQH